jgi:predicted lipid-binding transport protein (Tim44 family)
MEFNNFMTNKTRIFVNSLVLISLALGAVSTAEAKRLGGGNSFGSKPSHSAPYSRSAAPSTSSRAASPAPVTPSHPAPVSQQPAPAQNSGSAWKDRAMGAAAGLAVGGLVGSMMNNGSEQHQVPIQNQQGYAQQPQNQDYQQAPMQPQGYAPAMNQGYSNNGVPHNSGGFGWFGWLLIAGLGYGAYRYFSANKKSTTPDYTPYPHTNNEPNYATSSANESGSAGFDTDLLFRKGESSVSSSTVDLAKSTPTNVPAGFDNGAFLHDVKNRYTLLQKAWDERDFAEIRGLTSDKVFAEIQDQLKSSTEVNKTDILKLEAEILEVRELTNEFEAVVLFDTIMREAEDDHPNQVREVWHFVKSKSGFQSNWILDGIQQLAD